MEEKKKSKRFFEPEFKADAVKLVESSSRSVF
jgi:transposase-like protein